MVKAGIVRLLCAVPLLLTAGLHAQERGMGNRPSHPDLPPVQNGSYYALVIGIDKYQAPMKQLKTAVADADAMAKILTERFGFRVTLLRDGEATRGAILDAITHFQETLNENDNLLIYYAGHGYAIRNPDNTYDKAYWLPVDATSVTSSNRIIADDLTTDIRLLPARHVLIVSDSCYAGGLSRDGTDAVAATPKPGVVEKMLAGRSRTLMASGGDEPVADGGGGGHSVFAAALLKALSAADASQFTATDLFVNQLEPQIAKSAEQVPRYDPIRFHGNEDSGDFVFTRKVEGGQQLSPPELAARQGIAMLREEPYAEAVRLLEEACDAKVATACTNLGWYSRRFNAMLGYKVEIGDPEAFIRDNANDNEVAKKLYGMGCELGDPTGCLGIADMLANGSAKDGKSKAIPYYGKACDGGRASGCAGEGLMLQAGGRVAEAIPLLVRGCEGGEEFACSTLGDIYHRGLGVAVDEGKAKFYQAKVCELAPLFCSLPQPRP